MAVQRDAPEIHPTAVVAPGAELGSGVVVGPYCVLGEQVRLGDRVRLESYVHIHGDTEVGEDAILGTGSVLGGEPQDTKYGGEPSRVRIGARTRLFEHVTVHRATGGEGVTRVGEDCILMSSSHVGHNARLGDHSVLVNGALLGGHAQVADHVILSAASAVHQFVRVGRLSLLGGGCMAIQDVPPFSIVEGSYPLVWRAPNIIGLRRAKLDAATRSAIAAALAELLTSGRNLRATAEEHLGHPVPEVHELAEFVMSSKRGVPRGYARRLRRLPGNDTDEGSEDYRALAGPWGG